MTDMTSLHDRHREHLERARQAIAERTYWSAYPEVPSGRIYGETAKDEGAAAYLQRLGAAFELDQPGEPGGVGAEVSPYGPALKVRYPKVDVSALVAAASAAMASWRETTPDERAGVCLEILHRLNARSFELANAVMHTTGQGFMMAFQAGGPHAQDRGLEAVAYAYEELHRIPAQVHWQKKVSKTDVVTLSKRYRIVPAGVAVLVACSTFPTWNGYPGLFASLMTGNAVIVKPHPGAILPLAITVEIAREVLRECGMDPNIVTLAADESDAPITKDLVTHDDVGIVDYTGGSVFGEWIEENAKQAVVYTEKAGVNPVIIDSADDLKPMCQNLAFTLSLYSGQMCTASQNIFIPADGIEIGGEKVSFDTVVDTLVTCIDGLLGDNARACEVLGAVQSSATVQRIRAASTSGGRVRRASTPIDNEHFPDANVHSPLLIELDASDREQFAREMFGPIAYVIKTEDTAQSIDLAASIAKDRGAITAAVYSTSPDVIARAEDATARAGVPLSCNLVGGIFVNQAAAFSDFHVSGANPAGNATLCDPSFVQGRFHIVQSRQLVPVEAGAHAGV